MASYRFTSTQDWFSSHIKRWLTIFPLVSSTQPRILEIGSWEGRSAVFLLDNLCKDGGEIVCIDHFDLFETEAGRERFAKIEHNIALTGKKARIMPQFSVPALMTILTEEITKTSPGFDWIYVDGSHEADDTMLDAELVWRLARKDSIIIFDDYHWKTEPEDSLHHPKRGIDAFLLLHQGEYERLSEPSEYQVIIKKLTDMRIGFLTDRSQAVENIDAALEYGINIALAVDSSYAVGAAVVIRSIIKTTPGRITLYIVDGGISTPDQSKLERTIDARTKERVTIKFLQLPPNEMASKHGIAWAKLDMIEVLPVERILYLDADILILDDLRKLWKMDLGDKAIGAARDVGHPMGHYQTARGPYFNAGVLLIDLTRVREELGGLRATGESMVSSKFRDQDALNNHFAGRWKSIGLEWNAQGLGTYANHPSEDRNPLQVELEKAKNPRIVHFTGPVNPSLVAVLNPFIQPPTAKPWGYFGAPGHPFEVAWWGVLEETPWKGFKNSPERRLESDAEVNTVIARAVETFRNRLPRP